MKKIKSAIKAISKKNYVFRNWFNRVQDWRRKRYYKRMYLDVPVNDKMVIFESFLGKQYACSPKAIYEAMKEDDAYRDYIFVWVFRRSDTMRKELGDERTIVVKYNTRRYFRAYAQAKYWVTNWRLSSAIVKKEGQVCIQTWHGTPLKKIGMDLTIEGNATTSQKKGHKMYLEDAKLYDFFVSPSAFCSKVFASAFGLSILKKENILIETGYPRNDALCSTGADEVKSLKEALGLPLDKKIVLYAPTWRDNQHTLGVGYTFDFDAHIKGFLDRVSDDYAVIVRLHYLIADSLDLSPYAGRVFDFSKLDDINQLYLVSDALITDYSSVFFDYSNLRRPILFYMYDLDDYQHNVRDFYIDLDELPGPILKTEEELLAVLDNLEDVEKGYLEKYNQFASKYTYLDDGRAGQRVAHMCIK